MIIYFPLNRKVYKQVVHISIMKITNPEYFNYRHAERRKYQNNKCKHCGKDISKLNKGKAPSQRRITCRSCGNRYTKGEYCFRVLARPSKENKKRSLNYGVTIPAIVVEKYNLLGKSFKINVSPYGKFVLYTRLKGDIK